MLVRQGSGRGVELPAGSSIVMPINMRAVWDCCQRARELGDPRRENQSPTGV